MKKNYIIEIKNLPVNTKLEDFNFLNEQFKIKLKIKKRICFIQILKNKFNIKNIKKEIYSKFNEINLSTFKKIPLELNDKSRVILIILENFDANLDKLMKILDQLKKEIKKIIFYKDKKKEHISYSLIQFENITLSKIYKKKIKEIFINKNIKHNIFYKKQNNIKINEEKSNERDFTKKNYSEKIESIKYENKWNEINFINKNTIRTKLNKKIIESSKTIDYSNMINCIYIHLNSNFKNILKFKEKIKSIKISSNKAVIFFKNKINFDDLKKYFWEIDIQKPIFNYDLFHNYFLLNDDIDINKFKNKNKLTINKNLLKEIKQIVDKSKNKIKNFNLKKFKFYNIFIFKSFKSLLEIIKDFSNSKFFNFFIQKLNYENYILISNQTDYKILNGKDYNLLMCL